MQADIYKDTSDNRLFSLAMHTNYSTVSCLGFQRGFLQSLHMKFFSHSAMNWRVNRCSCWVLPLRSATAEWSKVFLHEACVARWLRGAGHGWQQQCINRLDSTAHLHSQMKWVNWLQWAASVSDSVTAELQCEKALSFKSPWVQWPACIWQLTPHWGQKVIHVKPGSHAQLLRLSHDIILPLWTVCTHVKSQSYDFTYPVWLGPAFKTRFSMTT